VGQLVDVELMSWDRWQNSKLNCPTLLWEELTKQLQLKGKTSCYLVKTLTLTTLYELADLLHFHIETNPVDRGRKYYS
jgi:hypothetical protein